MSRDKKREGTGSATEDLTTLLPRGLAGVIFDCDGVMIDSREANRTFYNRVLEHYGLAPMTAEQEQYCHMATSAQALAHILPEELHERIPFIGRDVVNYRKQIMPLVKIFPGFLDFAIFLHNHCIRMAVLTNRTANGIRGVLDFFALPPYFDPVMSASEGCCKPAPGGAMAILSQWAAAPDQVLLIGDSEVDRGCAKACGIPFAASPAAPAALAADYHMLSYRALQDDIGTVITRGSISLEK